MDVNNDINEAGGDEEAGMDFLLSDGQGPDSR